MSEWINVKDRAPENNEDVTLYSSDLGVVNGYYWPLTGDSNSKFVTHSGDCGDGPRADITHWMPKPNPPKDA